MKKILLTILILVLTSQSIVCDNYKEDQKTVHIGYSIELFNEVDINDALVAIQLWTDQLLKEFKDVYKVENKIYNSNIEIIDAYNNKKVDIISLLSVSYFELIGEINLDPLLSSNQTGISGYEYVILSRKESQVVSISDLEDKSIILTPSNFSKVSEIWLKSKTKEISTFFSKFSRATKPSQAILSVFFKKFDACLVPYFTFETMAELNPQIKNELTIVEKSEPLLNGMVCIRKSLDNQVKEDFLQFIENLQISTSGKLLTSLFGVLELKPYDKIILNKTKKIYDENDK